LQSSALQRAVARLTELTGAEHVAFLGKYARDPAAWMRECIAWPMGSAPTDYQLQLATDLMAHERMAIRAPRGTGKTTWAALIVLWYVVTREMMRVD
jgi:superfamily II DNA or RNA helicase